MIPAPQLSLPGLALTRAINSLTVFGPSSARMFSSEVFLDASVIGAKSLSGS